MPITCQNPQDLKHRSDAVVRNGVVHVSGAVPHDPTADIAGQTRQVLDELDARLARAGTDKAHLLSATIWREDVNGDAAAFNAVWTAWVVPGRQPARACVQAVLQAGARVELALVAALPDDRP